MKELSVTDGKYSFYIPLAYETPTLVRGDSGIGKSYLWQLLRGMYKRKQINCCCIDKSSLETLKALYSCNFELYVIDDFDYLASWDNKLIPFLNEMYKYNIKVIIFARDVSGMKLTTDFCFDMVQDGNAIGVEGCYTHKRYFGNK